MYSGVKCITILPEMWKLQTIIKHLNVVSIVPPFGRVKSALSIAGLPIKYAVVPVSGYRPKVPHTNQALIVPNKTASTGIIKRFYI